MTTGHIPGVDWPKIRQALSQERKDALDRLITNDKETSRRRETRMDGGRVLSDTIVPEVKPMQIKSADGSLVDVPELPINAGVKHDPYVLVRVATQAHFERGEKAAARISVLALDLLAMVRVSKSASTIEEENVNALLFMLMKEMSVVANWNKTTLSMIAHNGMGDA